VPESDNGGVTINDVTRNAKARGLTHEIVERTGGGGDKTGAFMTGRSGTKARVVEGQLLGRIDRRIRSTPGRSEEFIDVAAPLVEEDTAALASAIGVNYDIGHRSRPRQLGWRLESAQNLNGHDGMNFPTRRTRVGFITASKRFLHVNNDVSLFAKLLADLVKRIDIESATQRFKLGSAIDVSKFWIILGKVSGERVSALTAVPAMLRVLMSP